MYHFHFSKDTLGDNFLIDLAELQPTRISALGQKFGLPCRLALHIDDSVCTVFAFVLASFVVFAVLQWINLFVNDHDLANYLRLTARL